MSQTKSDLEISRQLVAQRLITQNQLTEALEYQCRLPPGQYLSLPQILIDFEFITPGQLEQALGQDLHAETDPITQLLIQDGLISERQLQQAMDILNAFPKQHLSDILRDLGFISQEQIETTISNHQLQQSKQLTKKSPVLHGLRSEHPLESAEVSADRQKSSPPIHLPLGRILIAKGWLTQKELDDALEYQHRLPEVMHQPLGAILISMGYLNQAQLDEALNEQKTRMHNPMGLKLIQAGLINESQLAQALSLQFDPAHAQKKLGNLLIELGFTTRDKIEAVLHSPPPSNPLPPPAPPETGTKLRPLGQLLLEKKFIAQEQLDMALAIQKQSSGHDYRPLGDILVLMGALTEAQLQEVLAAQPTFSREPIGQILIRQGLIAEWQLAHALCLQHEPGRATKNLGPILVELGYISQNEIEAALQKNIRDQFTDPLRK